MDDITYTALAIANSQSTTNEESLKYMVREKFTPNKFTEINNKIHVLFQSNDYFQSYIVGGIIPENPRNEMRLTNHAIKLFLAEKEIRDKIEYEKQLDLSKKEKSNWKEKNWIAYEIIKTTIIVILTIVITLYINHLIQIKSITKQSTYPVLKDSLK